MNNYIGVIADELYELGIQNIVISPGSRSTPLSMFFCEHKFKTYMSIDERSAGFFALGIAKEMRQPVVLVCTSGSAAAHYLPAVMEAKISRIPLIILTADRPPEFQKVGAPQTINQSKLYGEYVNYYEELSIPTHNLQYIYPRLVMRKAYMYSRFPTSGPVQINVPIREPLIPDLEKNIFEEGRLEQKFQVVSGINQVEFAEEIFIEKKGIIICGGDSNSNYHKEVIKLAEALKVPLLADPLSNIRNYNSDVIIDSYDSFLKKGEVVKDLKPDYILLFGQPPVSKRLQQFISFYNDVLCIQVDSKIEYRNPSLSTKKFVYSDIASFIKEITLQNIESDYLRRWKFYQNQMRERLNLISLEEELFEGKIVCLIQQKVPNDSRLFISNSMSIRNVDSFWEKASKKVKFLCNRGTNGIDGTISTALGVSTNGYPTFLLTGDLAFFHDLNGLLIGKMNSLNLVIILLNNNGGGIFQYLPQSEEKYFEYLFSTPHDIEFLGTEVLYGVRYSNVGNYLEFETCLEKAINEQGIHLIEVKTNIENSKKINEKYTVL